MQRPKTPAMREVEHRRGREMREDLLALLEMGESQEAIGRLYRVDASTINRWMERLGVPSRRWAVPEMEVAG